MEFERFGCFRFVFGLSAELGGIVNLIMLFIDLKDDSAEYELRDKAASPSVCTWHEWLIYTICLICCTDLQCRPQAWQPILVDCHAERLKTVVQACWSDLNVVVMALPLSLIASG